MSVDAIANEQAMRYLADELARAQLQAAQAVGTLALAQKRHAELEARITELEAEEAQMNDPTLTPQADGPAESRPGA